MPRKSAKLNDQPIPILEIETPEVKPPLIEQSTITFKRSHFFTALSVLTFFFGLFAGYAIWGTTWFSSLGTSNTQTANQAELVEEPQVIRYDIPAEGYPSIGPADAPITVVEFSDYQCPYCKRWHDEVYEPLLVAYPGKIRLVMRHLPLTTIHPDAFSAAEAAMCAGDQNAYWQFHERLFAGNLFGAGVYSQYASALNLNVTLFENCLNGEKHEAAIQADSDFAINLGVNSTPTFFINGLAVVGAQPLNVFQQVIDKELAGDFPQ